MRKAAAYVFMGFLLLVWATGDLFLLTRSGCLSRIARTQIECRFGDQLRVREIHADMDGTITLEGVEFQLGNPSFPPQEAGRVRLELRGLTSPSVRRVTVEDVRLHLSSSLIEDLTRGESHRSIRDLFPNSEDLPQIVLKGGTADVSVPVLMGEGRTLRVRVGTWSATPLTGYSCHVEGEADGGVFGDWTARGEADLETGELGFTVAAQGYGFDPAIRDFLAPPFVGIYEKYKPGGRADLAVLLEKKKGGELGFRVILEARDMQLLYRNFPYPVDHVQGEIEFRANGFTVKNMTGRHGPATLRFDGGAGGYPEESPYTFRIELDDVPLDGALRGALKDESQKAWDRFSPAGRANAKGLVMREAGADKPARIPVSVRVSDATLRLRDFPYDIRGVSGEIGIEGDDVDVRQLVSQEGDRRLEVTGRIKDLTKETALDLEIDARGFPLDERLKDALGEKAKQTWEEFSPGGVVDGRVRLRQEKGKELDYTATVRARGNTLTMKAVPIPVSDLDGLIELTPGHVRLRHMMGKAHGARLEVNGTIGEGVLNLEMDAVGLALDDEVKRAVPPEVGAFLKQSKLSAVVTLRASFRIRKGGEKRFTLDLAISKGVIDTDPKLEGLEAHASVEGFHDAKGLWLHGPIGFSSVTVAGKRLTDGAASLSVMGPKINIVNIKATAYGGLIAGQSFWVDTDTGEIGSDALTVDRLDIREFTLDTQGYSKKALSGKASLEVHALAGRASDPSTLTGTGRLKIQDGALWDIPLFASLFTLNPQDLFKKKNQFDAAVIDFRIKNRKFDIGRLSFTSDSVSVIGKGTVDFDGNLDLMLKTRTGFFGIDFAPLSLVTGVFDELKDQFVGVAVTGTFDKPVTYEKAFPGLNSKK
jgi:hypothetical protein